MLHWFGKRLREMQEAKRDERGFTLLELLIVILIIGILSAIALPIFLSQSRKAEIATCASDARNAAAASTGYLAGPGNGSYVGLTVPLLEAQGFNPTDNTAGNYPVSVSVSGVGAAAIATITVGCKGDGNAVWNSDTGVVTRPTS